MVPSGGKRQKRYSQRKLELSVKEEPKKKKKGVSEPKRRKCQEKCGRRSMVTNNFVTRLKKLRTKIGFGEKKMGGDFRNHFSEVEEVDIS